MDITELAADLNRIHTQAQQLAQSLDSPGAEATLARVDIGYAIIDLRRAAAMLTRAATHLTQAGA